MSYIVTLTIEVASDNIMEGVRAASRCAEAVDAESDDYTVINIEYKKKHEIPAGYTHRGGMIVTPADSSTVRTWNDAGEEERLV